MPKISNQHLLKVIERHEEENFRNQLKLWLEGKASLPKCPECNFEQGYYCYKHEKLAQEVFNEMIS